MLADLGPGSARLDLRRFADDFPAALGDLGPGEAARLAIPIDAVRRPWELQVRGAPVAVCPV